MRAWRRSKRGRPLTWEAPSAFNRRRRVSRGNLPQRAQKILYLEGLLHRRTAAPLAHLSCVFSASVGRGEDDVCGQIGAMPFDPPVEIFPGNVTRHFPPSRDACSAGFRFTGGYEGPKESANCKLTLAKKVGQQNSGEHVPCRIMDRRRRRPWNQK